MTVTMVSEKSKRAWYSPYSGVGRVVPIIVTPNAATTTANAGPGSRRREERLTAGEPAGRVGHSPRRGSPAHGARPSHLPMDPLFADSGRRSVCDGNA